MSSVWEMLRADVSVLPCDTSAELSCYVFVNVFFLDIAVVKDPG